LSRIYGRRLLLLLLLVVVVMVMGHRTRAGTVLRADRLTSLSR